MSRPPDSFLAIHILLVLTGSAWAEVCKGREAPKAKIAAYDFQADLASADRDMGAAPAAVRGGEAARLLNVGRRLVEKARSLIDDSPEFTASR